MVLEIAHEIYNTLSGLCCGTVKDVHISTIYGFDHDLGSSCKPRKMV